MKNPLTSFINVFGLSFAIGCMLVVYTSVRHDRGMDQYHVKKENLFMSTIKIDRDGEVARYGMSPVAYGPAVLQDFPQVKAMTRMEGRSAIAKHGDKIFNQHVYFVDNDFLDMFTFPLKWGDKNSLKDPTQVVLSENTAVKYFGDENPVGKMIALDFGSGKKGTWRVGGVADTFSKQSSIRFNLLLNTANLRTVDPTFTKGEWGNFVQATFFELENPLEAAVVQQQLQVYISQQNAVQNDWKVEEFQFEPFVTLYENSNYIRASISGQADLEGQVIMSILGAFMLILACLNYVNIAIVSASRRLKEIGVRKVMGSGKGGLVVQFLIENLLLTSLAMTFGFVLAYTFLIPQFDALFSIGLEIDLNDNNLSFFTSGLLVFTTLCSGAYPAFYIARFDAINIFVGRLRFGKKNRLTKSFLVVQFILSCIMVVCGIMIVENSHYQRARDWGYDQNQGLVVQVPDYESFTKLKNAVQENPDIISISGSGTHLGRSSDEFVLQTPERKYDVMGMKIDPEYIGTMGLKIKEGRNFQTTMESENNKVLVNASLVSALGWEDALGQSFTMDSVKYTVIGVLEDYHHYSFWTTIRPTVLRLANEDEYKFLSVRVKETETIATFDYLQNRWAELFPESPFIGYYQDEMMAFYFEAISGHGKLITFVAFLAVLLSSMGLYGLVSLNVAGRVKEFSIRKVLGANLMNIARTINKEFVPIVLISMLIGGPLSFYLMTILFDQIYDYYKPITVVPVIMTIALLIGVIGMTIFTQVRKVAASNPTDGLRNE